MIGTARRERIETLARVLDGDLDAGEVGREIRSLATLAGHVHDEADEIVMSAEARDAVRDRLLAELLHPTPEPTPTRTRVARPRRTVVATGVASVLIGATGVTVAAQEALPDDALYGIKRATESVRLAMAGDTLQTGRVELALARERLEEATAGADRLRPETLVATLGEMDTRSLAGAEALVSVAVHHDQPEHLAAVLAFTEEQAAGLIALADDLPVVVRPHVEDSLSTLRRIQVELLAPALEACDCADVVAAGTADCLVCGLEDLGSRVVSSPLPRPAPEERAPAEADETPEPADVDLPDPADQRVEGEPGEEPAVIADPPPSNGGGNGDTRTEAPDLRQPSTGVGRVVDEVGETVGETVDRVGDTVGRIAEDTTGTVGRIVEDTGRGVEGVIRGEPDAVPGLVEDTLGNVGDAADDTLGNVGGLLGRDRDRG